MKEFACGDVVPGCTARFRGHTDDEILAQVGTHAREAHGMTEVPSSLVAQVQGAIRAV
jgi:predicted small metal-binding protein